MRGQLSIEFMVVFTGILLIVASVTYPLYQRARADAEKLTVLSDAREAANILANALNSVYAGGPGSRQTVEYWLPKGVVGIYAHIGEDGAETSDENVAKNGRADVQIELDLDGDGAWDNKREALVLVDTLIPSMWYENGENRDKNWLMENGLTIYNENLTFDPAYRTHHQVTLEYKYGPMVVPITLDNKKLDDGEKYKFKTTLFGVRVKVDAENNKETGAEDKIIVRKFELKRPGEKVETSGEGTDFTLTLTLADVTVQVVVGNGRITVQQIAAPPGYYKQILITDVITGRL